MHHGLRHLEKGKPRACLEPVALQATVMPSEAGRTGRRFRYLGGGNQIRGLRIFLQHLRHGEDGKRAAQGFAILLHGLQPRFDQRRDTLADLHGRQPRGRQLRRPFLKGSMSIYVVSGI